MNDKRENKMLVSILAFKGEDEIADFSGELEVTEVDASDAEIAFNFGKERIYLRFDAATLFKLIHACGRKS